jgi:uncharacterized membrane protein YfcA
MTAFVHLFYGAHLNWPVILLMLASFGLGTYIGKHFGKE